MMRVVNTIIRIIYAKVLEDGAGRDGGDIEPSPVSRRW